ncbi:GspH/FimT family pseudopilin [Microbulbifer sp. JMSA003]|uniref:GspH/FimT family pseudopilin n=1 Tax=Microbulbifer sp. JMSA003 TaxID=3243369 RepID=UPI004039DC37
MSNFVNARGLTLIELLISVTLLGIVLAIGIPSFSSLIDSNRLTTTTNDWISTLQYARSEAVRSREQVNVTAISDDIGNGFTVWLDSNGNSKFDSGEELRVLAVEFPDMGITAKEGDAAVTKLNFSFNAVGEASIGDALTLSICDAREGNFGRQVELFVSGAFRLTKNIACNIDEEASAGEEDDA